MENVTFKCKTDMTFIKLDKIREKCYKCCAVRVFFNSVDILFLTVVRDHFIVLNVSISVKC